MAMFKINSFLFLENTRFKTLEHLLKRQSFETTLPNFPLGESKIKGKYTVVQVFFYVATAIATAIYSKNMTRSIDYF